MPKPARPARAATMLAAASAAVAAAAWTPAAAAPDARAAATEVRVPATSLAGSYLSGRFAQRADDWNAAADYMAEALERDPDNVSLLRHTFLLLVRAGRMDEALASARALVAHEPASQLANVLLVAEDLRAGDGEGAAARLEGMSREGMAQFLLPLLDAWVLVARGAHAEAVEALEPLSALTGLRPLYELHRALVLERAGDDAAAAEAYARATDGGAPLRVVQAAASHLARTGRAEEADAVVARFRDANPDAAIAPVPGPRPMVADPAQGAAEALFNLAAALDQEGADETALLYGRMALHLRPDFGLARLVVGDVLMGRERAAEALAEYRAAEADPQVGWAAGLRVGQALDALDRHDEAVAHLEAMSARRTERWDALSQMGDVLRREERFEEAVGPYTRALERIGEPRDRHWALLYARGIAYERSGRWPEAEADFEAALRLSPDQPYVLNYLGYTWIDRGEHLERGKAMVERAVQLRPDDGYIVDSLGWAYYRLGDFPNAVRHLERAVELQPLDPTINDHLGDAYWAVGRFNEARFQWNRALLTAEEADVIAGIREKLDRRTPRRQTAGAGTAGAGGAVPR
jgi:tetratricopeptide (TPR) repeat protein